MKIVKSFKSAIQGIIYALKNERHMRFHSVACVFVFILSLFFNFTAQKYTVLILTVALVMISEMINSALENIVDIFVKDYNASAKISKDIAAGAVLIAAAFAAMVAVFLFNDVNVYINIFSFLIFHPFLLVFLILLAILSFFYIWLGPTEMRNRARKIFSRFKQK